jgi:transcription antitermination factor NusG
MPQTDQPVSRCGRIAGLAGWAVIRTHPQAESLAIRAIEALGYRGYLPVCVVRRGQSQHTAPLFPRYAFVLIPEHQPWTPVRYSPGVDQLLMNGMRPAYVPEDAIELLQANDDARRVVPPPGADWRPGDACKVLHGAGYDLDGVVREIRGARADVGVMMFGELRNIDVDVQRLRVRDE